MLRLRIENFDRLPDGGPLDYAVDRRGFDFGRDSHLDWALPDKTRVISGKHCEVRYYDDSYWLIDVSTNGTFVNGNSKRVKSPYQLNEGDRLHIGEYVISVTLDLPPRNMAPASMEPLQSPELPVRRAGLWDAGGEVPPPIDAKELLPKPAPGEVAPDFLHRAMFVPPVRREEPPPVRPPPVPEGAWAAGSAPARAETPSPPATPSPSAPISAPVVSAASAQAASSNEFLRRFAKGVRLPVDALDKTDPGELAELAGELLYLACANTMSLLQARAEAKALSKSGSRTLIRSTENNPLKFMPTPEEALQAMLAPRGAGYLGGKETLERSFADLKNHHLVLLAAMQAAASQLLDELSPLALEKGGDKKKSLLGGGKGKLWDELVKQWNDKSGRRENGMLDVFLDLFAEHYDRFSRMKSS